MNVVYDKVNDVKIHRNAENYVSERTELRRVVVVISVRSFYPVGQAP